MDGKKMDKYLIEIRFHGYAKKYLKKLIFEISKKFRVKGVTRRRVVPHITLFGPFTTNKQGKMISNVVSVLGKYDLVPFEITGFKNFNNNVIFVDIKPSIELEELRRKIAQSLFPISKTVNFDRDIDFKFHGTVAFKDIEYKFNDIWSYLKEKEEPNIMQYLLRITIVKNNIILYEYDLMQKKLLNRSQSLSRNIWSKTVNILKSKTSFGERENVMRMEETASGICAGCERKFAVLYKRGNLFYCEKCLKSLKADFFEKNQSKVKSNDTWQHDSKKNIRRIGYSKRRSSNLKRPVAILIILVIGVLCYFNSSLIFGGPLKFAKNCVLGPDINISELEWNIHLLINKERDSYGLHSLEYDYELAEIARNHSEDMAKNNFFSHTNLGGEDPTDRARRHGYMLHKELGGGWYSEGIGENIFLLWRYDSTVYIYLIPIHDWNSQIEIAEDAVNGWMYSYGHRQNILNSNYSKEGIGVAILGDKIYVTQDFW